MRPTLVRLRVPAMVAAAGAVALLSACEDKRMKAVDTGMTRDQVISQLSVDAPRTSTHDSMPNVSVRETYFINGKNYEVLYFDPSGAKATKDTVWKDLTPVLMIENKVIGKGWDFWDSVATSERIPLKKRDQK